MAKKLEEIKEEECPYELPEGWKWERLGNVADWSSGGTPSRKHQEYYDGGKINWLKTGDLNDGYIYSTEERITEAGIKKSSAKIFPIDTVIIAMYGATIGKCGILQIESATNQACACAICNAHIFNKYLYYYLMNSKYRFIELGKGGAQPNISQTIIINFLLPLPPKETQQKIVDIIESLFAKLDIAQEKVEQVLAESENRRSAILHNAFSGKLTEKWREENKNIVIEDIDLSLIDKNYDVQELEYDLPSTWKWVTFNEICTFIGSGVTPKGGQEVYTLNGIPFIRSQNVLRLKLDLSDVAYISDEINSKMKRTQIKGGETLFNITGASIGRACYVHRKQNTGNVNQHVCILRYKNFILENLPQYWLNSSMMQYFISDNQIGQTRQALNFKQIRGIMFPLCPYEEQKEIVRLLDKFLSVEDKVKSTCQSTLEAIATMRKSILAKAFRGELVS